MSTFKSLCGWFPNIRKKGSNRAVLAVLDEIKDGKWRVEIERLRSLTGKSYAEAKKRLPAVMLSASSQTGGHKEVDLKEHTGLLQIDIDHLSTSEEAVAMRERMRDAPHVFAAWVSPGGKGIKALLRIAPSFKNHRANFSAAQRWYFDEYTVTIDPTCGDPCRLCFVSHDPDLWLNLEATEFVLGASTPPLPDSTTSLPPTSCNLPAATCTLHNTKIFQEFQFLEPFYQHLVAKRFGKIQSGLRNAALCDMVPRLYSAIHPRFILSFAEEFYLNNRSVFRDTLGDHLKEAESLLRGCEGSYASRQLSEQERRAYAALQSDDLNCAFRICHSLALSENEVCPPPEFFLSAEKLAHRLGILDTQAWRLLRVLEKNLIIREVEKGQRRSKGQVARATRFRWMLPFESRHGVRAASD